MPDWLMWVLIVVGVIVLALILWSATQRARKKKVEHERRSSLEHRQEAQARAQRAGEAEVEARRAADEAAHERERAVELDRKAAELDPDRGDRR